MNKAQRLLSESFHKDRFTNALENPIVPPEEERERVKKLVEIELDWWGDSKTYASTEDITKDVETGALAEVSSDENLYLIMRFQNPDLEKWQPYLTKEARDLLQDIGKRWRLEMNKNNLPRNIKLAVTNLVISKEYRDEIIKLGRLATDKASHAKGQSMDIDGCGYYQDDEPINPRFTENYAEVYKPEVHKILKKILDKMSGEGYLHYVLEFEDTNNQSFHITRSPSYTGMQSS